MKKTLLVVPIIVLIIVLLGYFLGPRMYTEPLQYNMPEMPEDIFDLQKQIVNKESATPNLRNLDRARIVWPQMNNAEKKEICFVFLHGFSASEEEGFPLHIDLAKRYNANLYLARLYGHAVDDPEPFHDFTPQKYLESAQEAIAIGNRLGEKVIVISSSTGSTLAMAIAAEFPEMIDGIIMYSPNVQIKSINASIVAGPWGLQIMRFGVGGKYREWTAEDYYVEHWTNRYRVEALVAMGVTVHQTMHKQTFEKITQPVFLGYTYESEEIQDDIVSVKHMQEMFGQLSTPADQKREMAFGNKGEHVLCNGQLSPDYEKVYSETCKFLEEVMELKVVWVDDF